MTTFFISQPMDGKTDEEIKADRRKCEAWLARAFGSFATIDSFIAEDAPKDCKNIPAWYLGESIKKLARADVLVLWGDWIDARGCLLEREVAIKYGIPVIKNGGKDDA